MATESNAHGIRILLVEDDADCALSLESVLKRRGVIVQTEVSAPAARRELSSNAYDAVVTDICLKGSSGIDLLKQIREFDTEFPVILLTGYDSLSSAIEAVRHGAHDYILKPIETIDDLLKPLVKAVRGYRACVENRRLQEELVRADRRHREMLDHAMDILFRWDCRRERLEYLSPAKLIALGYDEEDWRPWGEAELIEKVHPEDRAAVRAGIAGLRKAAEKKGVRCGGMFPAEFRFLRRSGGYVWLSLCLQEIVDECGMLCAVVGSARDISDRKAAESRWAEERERLILSEKLRSSGISGGYIAHELGNVLMPIVGLPDMILQDLDALGQGPKVQQIRSDLTIVRNAAREAGDRLRDLLQPNQPGRYDMVASDLNEIVRDLTRGTGFSTLCEARPRIRMEVCMGPSPLPVKVSAPHVVQALLNLLANAFDAIGDKGTVRIESGRRRIETPVSGVWTVPAGEYAVLSVRDSGRGMAADQLARAFEPFYTTKTSGNDAGAGIGLPMVYCVVRDHGGYLNVRTSEGAGTEASLYFPLTTEPVLAAKSEEQIEALMGHERILVVDDAVTQCEMARRCLSSLGYDVQVVTSGDEAVRLFRRQAQRGVSRDAGFDLVMLDMILESGFDGLDTYREMLRCRPAQPCILLSAFGRDERVAEGIRLGAFAFVSKPFTPVALGRAVREALDRREPVSGVVL